MTSTNAQPASQQPLQVNKGTQCNDVERITDQVLTTTYKAPVDALQLRCDETLVPTLLTRLGQNIAKSVLTNKRDEAVQLANKIYKRDEQRAIERQAIDDSGMSVTIYGEVYCDDECEYVDDSDRCFHCGATKDDVDVFRFIESQQTIGLSCTLDNHTFYHNDEILLNLKEIEMIANQTSLAHIMTSDLSMIVHKRVMYILNKLFKDL